MKVTNEKTENSQVFLTIEMEPAEMEESLERSYHRLVGRARIPGFRKGKAPRALLERYLGKDSLLEEALDELLPKSYQQAIKEQAIEAFAQPQIEVTQTEPLVFKAIVPLRPKVKLGDYQQIQVVPQPVAVTEDEVKEAIEQLRHQQAIWEPVERPVDFGDLVIFKIESHTEEASFINQEVAQYQVTRDLPLPVPGFAEQLAGMKRDEEKEFKLQLPSDFPRAELAGKEIWFKVKVSEIKQEIPPELNDEFAGKINPEFKTLESLRERVSDGLKLNAEQKARADLEARVIDAVVAVSELEFPPILVEAEIHRMLDQRFQRGDQEVEEYLQSINKTEEELHEELRPLAIEIVGRSLVLGKVAEEEKIEAADAEVDTEIERIMAGASGNNKDELKKALDSPQARQSIKQTLVTRKTIQRLVEIAETSLAETTVETVETTKETKKTKRGRKKNE